jgi:hypothetical protein
MQPYQEASQEVRRQAGVPAKALGMAGSFASGALLGSASKFALDKVLPLLSEFVPEDFARKALRKIDPRIGKFIDKAVESGNDYGEIKTFIKQKADSHIENEQKKNPIQRHSPELHQFILDQIQQGRSPIEAGALASLDKKGGQGFKKIIKKIEEEHKSPWSSILEAVYGASQQGQAPTQQQQPAQVQENNPIASGQGQPGNVRQDRLMGSIQNLTKLLGG